jgi:dephospho-CoA kinase
LKVIAITGGLCTGKSWLAGIFSGDFNIPVFNSDKYVKQLYTQEYIKQQIKPLFPEVFDDNGEIILGKLASIIFSNKQRKQQLEAIIIPRVIEGLKAFQNYNKQQGKSLVVAEIPLLYEQNLSSYADTAIVTYCSAKTREHRALIERKIKPENYYNILARQMNLSEKIYMADILVDTEISKEYARELVSQIISGDNIYE